MDERDARTYGKFGGHTGSCSEIDGFSQSWENMTRMTMHKHVDECMLQQKADAVSLFLLARGGSEYRLFVTRLTRSGSTLKHDRHERISTPARRESSCSDFRSTQPEYGETP